MKEYLVRFLKYLCFYLILSAVVVTLIYLFRFGDSEQVSFRSVIISREGIYLAIALIAFSALYPVIYTTKQRTRVLSRQEIEDGMKRAGYSLTGTTGKGEAVYRSDNTWQRIKMKLDDAVKVKTEGGETVFSGSRAAVARTFYHMERE